MSANSQIRITDITIKFSKAPRSLPSVNLLIDDEYKETQWTNNEKVIKAAPLSLDLSISQTFTLRVRYPRRGWFDGERNITISARDLLNRQNWCKSYGEMELDLTLGSSPSSQNRQETGHQYISVAAGEGQAAESSHSSTDVPLRSTTDEIFAICPRFRVLVIGKSGAGKSTLINIAFGVTEGKANVSHLLAGESDINEEIICKANEQFVLHDSKGFEGGEVQNLSIVQRFLERRNETAAIKDQVHAVWLCLPVSTAGGRILETGVEEFLQLKSSGKLGKVPVIAIFTKYDMLFARAGRQLDTATRTTMDKTQIDERINEQVATIFQEVCVRPLMKYTGENGVLHIPVSTKKGHEQTLKDLVQLTTASVLEHVSEVASIVSGIAQQVNPNVKIDASIAVGKRRYWRSLASSISFFGKTLVACFEVIRRDLVVVWNMNDPHNHLYSDEFQKLILDMVGDCSDTKAVDATKNLVAGASSVAGLVSIAGPAAPFLIPVAATMVFAKWVYDVYKQTQDVLLHLMAYLVHLILVLQLLFLVLANLNREITSPLVKQVVGAYKDSNAKAEVHSAIKKYVDGTGIFGRTDRDKALDTVTELISRYSKDPEMLKLRDEIVSAHFRAAGTH